jgi:PAS domain S-box-containing protein
MEISLFRRNLAPRSPWQSLRAYVFAVASCALAWGLTLPLLGYLQPAPRLLLFFAVVASGRFGGLGPGVLATALASFMGAQLPGPFGYAANGYSVAAFASVCLVSVAVVAQLRTRALALHGKEEQLTDFMENATVGLHWMAADGTVLWANSATCEMLNCSSAGGCVGRKFQAFCASADEAADLLRRLTGNEHLKNHEIHLRTRDGSPRVALLDANVLWNDGQFVHARCFLRDVTARKQAELAVQEHGAKFRAVFDHSIDSIVMIKDSRLCMANPAFLKLFGYGNMETLVTKGVLDMIAPSHHAQVREYMERRARGENAPFYYQTRGLRRDGTEFDMEVSATAFVLHGYRHTLAIVRDVTQRLRSEEIIAQERNLLRTVIDALPDCIYTKDTESRFLISNLANVRLLGASTEAEVHGRSLFDLCPPEYARPFVEDDQQVIRTGQPLYHREESLLCPDGERRTFLTTKLPLRNAAGEITGLAGISRDITDRKQIEEAIREMNEELEARVQERTQQLEQANRELEAFSYSISHDLRAPVRAISGFAQIIHEDHGHQLEGEVARLFKVIATSACRMGELIDDLLAFSRLNAKELERLPVDMTALAQSVLAELLRDRRDGQASVRLTDLPEAVGDESMLRQVLTNLTSNALKFSRSSPSPTVEIGSRLEGEGTVYFVRDNGVGFDMRYAPKLFKVFQRLHNTEQFEGTGVGLAIVQRIIQRHGGRVWAESQPGEGATFSFTLPPAPQNGSSARLDGSPMELTGTDDRRA